MQKNITKYYCDICKKETIEEYGFPLWVYDCAGGMDWSLHFCEECLNKTTMARFLHWLKKEWKWWKEEPEADKKRKKLRMKPKKK